jgi:hypothetical protein
MKKQCEKMALALTISDHQGVMNTFEESLQAKEDETIEQHLD